MAVLSLPTSPVTLANYPQFLHRLFQHIVALLSLQRSLVCSRLIQAIIIWGEVPDCKINQVLIFFNTIFPANSSSYIKQPTHTSHTDHLQLHKMVYYAI